ncbi:MAG: hypothetical protein ACJAS9_000052 [Polaribacter sp.]|jgi:hypothetical protein
MGRADIVIKKIAKLYGIEKNIKGLPVNEKYKIRQEKIIATIKRIKKVVVG